MTLTVRTQQEHEAAIIRVGKLMGEKTATRTLLKSLMQYEMHCEQIQSLRAELRRVERERDQYREKIERFKAAHAAMLE